MRRDPVLHPRSYALPEPARWPATVTLADGTSELATLEGEPCGNPPTYRDVLGRTFRRRAGHGNRLFEIAE